MDDEKSLSPEEAIAILSERYKYMSFHQNQNRKAVCPLYESMVKSSNCKIAGIQCACLDPGCNASVIVRLHGFNELMRHKRQFCDSMDGYRRCQCYRQYEKLNQ